MDLDLSADGLVRLEDNLHDGAGGEEGGRLGPAAVHSCPVPPLLPVQPVPHFQTVVGACLRGF
jgi:hypothetical protein